MSEREESSNIAQDKQIVLNNFISKLEATIVNSTYAEPVGISTKSRALLLEDFWKTWTTAPLDISAEGVRKFVTKVFSPPVHPFFRFCA